MGGGCIGGGLWSVWGTGGGEGRGLEINKIKRKKTKTYISPAIQTPETVSSPPSLILAMLWLLRPLLRLSTSQLSELFGRPPSFSDTDLDLFLTYFSAPANSARSRHPSLVLLLF